MSLFDPLFQGMNNNYSKIETIAGEAGNILITGGTSGLGLELVKIFHEKGFYVICTGRQSKKLPCFKERFKFISVDFRNLAETARTLNEICKTSKPGFVICNAGILSPPGFKLTGDGFECTFQVNFLAHLLVNEIIIRNKRDNYPLKIALVTSPVYKMAKSFPGWMRDIRNYKPLRSYSDSKLFLALMGSHLAPKYPEKNLLCFSVDPGVFNSSIYRTQGKIFGFLYRVAAPFMRNPADIAGAIYEMMVDQDFSAGAIYNIRKRMEYLPEYDKDITRSFWDRCDEAVEQYIVG
jgi:NAD(P)-dependent dehydrogenase (short-subunit alcohol dehydrogenase family)